MTEPAPNPKAGLPELLGLPFPVRRHPGHAHMEVHLRHWADQFGLTPTSETAQHLTASRFAAMAAHAYPSAPQPRADWAADWITWLFLLDDQLEEGAHGSENRWSEVIDAVRAVLRSPQAVGAAGPPLIRAWADLCSRVGPWATPAWKARFGAHLLESLHGALQEIRLRDQGIPPTLDEYTALGRASSASLPVFDTVEICVGAELPEHLYNITLYREFLHAAADVFCWSNDLCSVQKERDAGMVTNLVLVLEHHDGLLPDEALGAIRALIRRRVQDLLAAREQLHHLEPSLSLPPAQARALHQNVTALCEWLTGTLWWHTAGGTTRYKVTDPDSAPPPIADLLTGPDDALPCHPGRREGDRVGQPGSVARRG
ncbi:terpene synthase family protein [Streptomyces virginiae]|uniref:terpene synthase family protein n=1 Tax=Streptomyces virginiae TaxID=1961 RepID=UPI0038166448